MGLITVIANLIVLNVHFRVEEGEHQVTLVVTESKFLRVVAWNTSLTRFFFLILRWIRCLPRLLSLGVLLTYLEKLGVEKGRIYSHPQIGNVSQLLETDFPKQGYFEREKDGEEYYYTLGPRLRGEISSGNLVDIINEVCFPH